MTEESLWEKIVRFSPAAIAMSACLAIMSSASISKRADYEILPLSTELVTQGDAAAKAGSKEDAAGLYETALAVDPRNKQAYIALARLVSGQGLSGKSIRYYDEALEIDPNDMTALSEQADVMVSKGGLSAARKNLARLKAICRTDCSVVDKLAMSIKTAGQKPALQASAVKVKPVVEKPDSKQN